MILLWPFIGLKIYQSILMPSSWSAHLSGTTNPFTANPENLQEIGLALARRVWSYNKSSRGFPAVRFSTPVSVMLNKENNQGKSASVRKYPLWTQLTEVCLQIVHSLRHPLSQQSSCPASAHLPTKVQD